MSDTQSHTDIEPWMKGAMPGVDPVIGHLLHASEHIQADLERALSSLTVTQLWNKPLGMTSAGFHILHLAGSTDRLCTYLEGQQLSAEQLQALEDESRPGTATARHLINQAENSLIRYERLLQTLKPEDYGRLREIGRRRLPATVIGLAIHIAEHGQRHVGQAITAAKLAVVSGC
jgi:hypothetical protein